MRALRPVVAAVALTTVLVAAWLAWSLLLSGPSREVEVTVAEGASASEVLEQLADTGLLPSPLAGRVYLAVAARGRSFRWGRYAVPAGSRPVDVLEQLLDGRVEATVVTLVEGLTVDEVAERLVSAGFGTPAEWRRLARRTSWVSDLAPEATSLEGFLFPDTYRFAEATSAAAVARHLVDRFHRVWEQERSSVATLWGTPYEVVTLASLVEAETSVPEERARIAGVFRNRLERGMLLQCDPTVAYALRRRNLWEGRLLRVHWELDDPYNTYRYPGLPPGPINSPGRAALAAAAAPERNDYLYFVARPGGGHTFSRTLREHNRAVARLRNARR